MQRALLVKQDIPNDLYEEFLSASELAVDCEMMGLNPYRDRLCLIQVAKEHGSCALVQIDESHPPLLLKQLLENEKILKIFHYARADCTFLQLRLQIHVKNIYCTKVASRIARTYTDRHGLKELVKEFTGDNLDKSITTTDWGRPDLTDDQMLYAQGDVIYLFHLRRVLDSMLQREKRDDILAKALRFLPDRIEMDIRGFGDDIFSH
jgi:ribonuclease D